MIRKLWAATFVAMLASAPAANASLIGQTANCDMQPGSIWACSPLSATVADPGVEFQLNLVGTPFFSVDLADSSLLLTLSNPNSALIMGAGEVLTLSGLDGILDATLNFSQASGFDGADISFTANSLTLVLNGSSWGSGQQALIDVKTAASVPEPATLALLGFGLAALALRRRRPAATRA